MKSAQRLLAISAVVLGFWSGVQHASAEVIVLPEVSAEPTTTLQIVDARPPQQRSSEYETLSSWVTSCSYGIVRVPDTFISPHKLIVLRADLEKELGNRLNGKTLTVWSYAIYSNGSHYFRSTAMAAAFGGVGIFGNFDAGPGCTAEETPEGWFDPAEAKGQTDGYVVQIGVRMGGKDYAVRAMSWPGTVRAQIFADLLHRAHASLAAKMSADDGPLAAAAVDNDTPFGIKTVGEVTRDSVVSIFFANDPHGVVISKLEPKGAAEQAGIQVGDVIMALDGKRITSFGDVKAAASGSTGSGVKADINRSGHVLILQLSP